MKVCLIHIGMEKAGSTAIQMNLAANAKRLKADGVIYPLPSRRGSSHTLFAAAYIDPQSPFFPRGARPASPWTRKRHDIPGFRQHVLEIVREASQIVLSSEHFLRLSTTEVAALKADLLAAGVDEFRVFGILREPSSFYLSFIQQELKGSSRIDPPRSFLWSYTRGIEAWQAHFPVTFYSYAALATHPGGVLSTLAAELEALFSLNSPALPEIAPRQNETLSPEEMQLLQNFRRRFYAHADGEITYLTKLFIRTLIRLREDEVTRPVLTPEAAAMVRARHAAELSRVRELTGLDLAASPSPAITEDVSADSGDVAAILENFDPNLYRQLSRRLAGRGPFVAASELFAFLRRFAGRRRLLHHM